MILAFRTRDFKIIKDTAQQLNAEVSEIILDAVRLIGLDPNLYTNPDTMDDYSSVEIIELETGEEDFRLIVDRADFHNYSIEVFIYEAIEILRTVKGLPEIQKDSENRPLSGSGQGYRVI